MEQHEWDNNFQNKHGNIDSSLEAKRTEWENLYLHPNFETNYQDAIPEDLTQQEKYELAANWYRDGLSGRKIDFPQSSFELTCMKVARSRRMLLLFSFACALHISLPFLNPPYCPWRDYINNEDLAGRDKLYSNYPNYSTLLSFEFLITLVYFAELAARLLVNNMENIKARKLSFDIKDKWTIFRLVCVCVIFIEVLLAIGNASPFRWTTGLVPFIYISRRKSLRQMLQGLMTATYHTGSVLLLLVTTLFIWSYAGYLLFRNVESHGDDRFSSFLKSCLTCLHIFASRTWSILALNPYFEKNSSSALFFVTLTIGADMLCSSLLIAIGSREYRIFASEVFTSQVRKRRYALICIHKLLAINGKLEMNDWIRMSACVKGRAYIPRETARALFLMECISANDVALDCTHFFRLLALASSNVIVNISTTDNNNYNNENNTSNNPSKSEIINITENSEGVKKGAFSRTQIVISDQTELRSTDKRSSSPSFITHVNKDSSSASQSKTKPTVKTAFYWNPDPKPAANEDDPKIANIDNDFLHPLSPSTSVSKLTSPMLRSDTSMRNTSSQLIFASGGSQHQLTSFKISYSDSQHDVSTVSPIQGDRVISKESSSEFDEDDLVPFESLPFTKVRRKLRWFMLNFFLRYRLICMKIVNLQFTITIMKKQYLIYAFETFFSIIPWILMVQLVVVTGHQSAHNWRTLGYVLESLFWVEMFIRLGCMGIVGYFHSVTKLMQTAINIASLMLGLAIGYGSFHNPSILVTLFLVVQMFRFFRVYRFIETFHIYETMVPVFLYVTFLVFSIIYFFAAISFNRFCDSMDIENVYDADDDSASWGLYSRQLNFRTFALSLYTLFQISIIGSWSMVMDTIAKVDPTSSLLFFYTYRLIMTLCILPLLFSFIIQIYIIRKDSTEKNNKSKKKDKVTSSAPPTSSADILSRPNSSINFDNSVNNYKDNNYNEDPINEHEHQSENNKETITTFGNRNKTNSVESTSVFSIFSDDPVPSRNNEVDEFLSQMDSGIKPKRSSMSSQVRQVNQVMGTEARRSSLQNPDRNSPSNSMGERRGSGGNLNTTTTLSSDSTSMNKKIDKIKRQSTGISVIVGDDNDAEVSGINLWKTADPVTKSQVEIVQQENEELKYLLAKAVSLLKEEKKRADKIEDESIKMNKLLDSGLMSQPATKF